MTLKDFIEKISIRTMIILRDKEGVTICECMSDSIVMDKFSDWLVVGFAPLNSTFCRTGLSIKIKENLPFD